MCIGKLPFLTWILRWILNIFVLTNVDLCSTWMHSSPWCSYINLQLFNSSIFFSLIFFSSFFLWKVKLLTSFPPKKKKKTDVELPYEPNAEFSVFQISKSHAIVITLVYISCLFMSCPILRREMVNVVLSIRYSSLGTRFSCFFFSF